MNVVVTVTVQYLYWLCWTFAVFVDVGVLVSEFGRNQIATVQSAQNKHLLTVTLSAFSEKCSLHLSHDPQGIYLSQKFSKCSSQSYCILKTIN